MKISFTKMQGCGNDYIYVNGFTEKVPAEDKPEIVRRLSDRHFGIGGDGVIFINPSEKADFEMEMYNLDGSRGEMCGNGIRCVGKYVYDRGMTDKTEISVESAGAVKQLTLYPDGKTIGSVRVDMGAPVLAPAGIPVIPEKLVPGSGENSCAGGGEEGMLLDVPFEVSGETWRMSAVSMGNPHAVIRLPEETDPDDLDLPSIGPAFENHPAFPRRTNTEFIRVIDRKTVKMRVWERGSGETLACGTGCCAVGVSCVLNGWTDREITVKVRGGELHIAWDGDPGHPVMMTGPAVEVFEGTVEI